MNRKSPNITRKFLLVVAIFMAILMTETAEGRRGSGGRKGATGMGGTAGGRVHHRRHSAAPSLSYPLVANKISLVERFIFNIFLTFLML
ncbi:hypothetical protein F511_01397 [Dorcoceras hygrometricum]|uniref:Uncharacterized protein n=1 Tax=Dorcoceras hygrometricum TaxID=472368 RepID=A0A2Z7BLR3_9LAMI|nr:hypothetical protein F511_01397 [Dorcoceras hygrometricum]